MRRTGFRALMAITGLVSACAGKVIPAPALTTLAYPDFVPPALSGVAPGTGQAVLVDRGWRFLQAGDLGNAERELQLALRSAPSFYPAETVLGYLSLARKQPADALAGFDRALAGRDDYLPAIIGRGQTLEALGRDTESLEAFERAAALDPSRVEIARRVEVLTFRRAEQRVERARKAAAEGRLDEASRDYRLAIADSPDSPFLRRELADVEIKRGARDAAVVQLRRAIALEPDDAASQVTLAEILEARGDLDGALEAFERALAIEPSERVANGRDRVRAQATLNRLPPQYRAIGGAAAVSRGELAALIGIRLPQLVAAAGDDQTVVVSDARDHWAERWIVAAARAAVMPAFPNHTFQPRAPVRRIELAQIADRLLTVAGVSPSPATDSSATGQATGGGDRLAFSDLAPSHSAFKAAVAAVLSGAVIPAPGAGRAFKPNVPASGEEAVRAIERIAEIAHLPPLGAVQP